MERACPQRQAYKGAWRRLRGLGAKEARASKKGFERANFETPLKETVLSV